MTRRATCQCGQLAIACEGDPVRVSVCHCLDCQKRSGSSFAAQARFPIEQTTVNGESKQWSRGEATFSFCPECGSTVFYHARPFREMVAVAIGAFAEPEFPSPYYSVYEARKHAWVEIMGDGIEHYE
ncbi:MAG: GFA family protein [Sphingomonas sp.]|uniref:GFA family protein n=1 Tax=Sphingomonas sp. TaxID=28214 RepID=UPI001AC2D1A0|nr:GFA family protein [Sphingomonas sp.]MBN8816665.1 GFA family protein [Sphingomonas sp.]